MRFLFGIFIGAALTLLIATATNAPTNPVLERVTGLWEQLIDATSQQLFDKSGTATIATGAVPAKQSTDDSMETAATPVTPLAGQKQTPVLDDTLPEAPLEQLADLQQSTQRPEPTTEIPAAIEPEITTEVATVWVPFHSERSANGFADTLSRHFEYPFSVRRNGPGAYQVTFSYVDLSQREDLLLNITELTGK
jgi:hypothetical protein